jgi:hypothetical protein
MIFTPAHNNIKIEATKPLYKWAKIYGSLQKKFFTEPINYRREKQIESFITLNEFDSVDFITDTDILHDAKEKYGSKSDAKLLVLTDLKFSRYPCKVMIKKIREYAEIYSALYICLNKCYINIDNTFHDSSLSSNYNQAISQWLKKSLKEYIVIDLSLDTIEDGQSFTWVIPDRHFFITKQ